MADYKRIHGGSRRRRRLAAERMEQTGIPPLIGAAALGSGALGLFTGSFIAERTPWDGILPWLDGPGGRAGPGLMSLAILGIGALGSGAMIWLSMNDTDKLGGGDIQLTLGN